MNLVLAVITDGRGEYLTRTLASAERRLKGPFTHRLIHDDSGDPDYRAWLHEQYGSKFTIVGGDRRLGQDRAVAAAREHVRDLDPDFAFWLEDDFTFRAPIEVRKMIRLLERHPELAQVALLRQPWFAAERRAGGIIALNPDAYTDRAEGQLRWVEHRQWYTLNPHVFPRHILDVPWPTGKRHEWDFGRRLCENPDVRFAYLGRKRDRPIVFHIGAERAQDRP